MKKTKKGFETCSQYITKLPTEAVNLTDSVQVVG